MRSRVKVVLAERRRKAFEVASALGVARDTVYLWCTDKGIGGLRLRDAERLARELGCRVSDLYEEGPTDGDL